MEVKKKTEKSGACGSLEIWRNSTRRRVGCRSMYWAHADQRDEQSKIREVVRDGFRKIQGERGETGPIKFVKGIATG